MQDTTKISKQICTWKQIWENKSSQLDTHLAPDGILKQLFVLTGFDSKSSSGLDVQNYLDFIRRVFGWAKLEDCESLYEVGCGAGAFLYAMSLEKNTKNGGGILHIGGIDYAKNLCAIAQSLLPNADITKLQAQDLPTAPQYDCVSSFGVFHYFENLEYARRVITKMIEKARKRVLFLDILDSKKQEQDIAYKIEAYGESEYKRLYGQLPHLYYEKSFFQEIAKMHNLKCEIQDQNIAGYHNSHFRFNCVMWKDK